MSVATSIWHRYSEPFLDIFFEVAPTGEFTDEVYRAQCTYSGEDGGGLDLDAEWTYSAGAEHTFAPIDLMPPPEIKALFTANIPQITAAFVAWRLGEPA